MDCTLAAGAKLRLARLEQGSGSPAPGQLTLLLEARHVPAASGRGLEAAAGIGFRTPSLHRYF